MALDTKRLLEAVMEISLFSKGGLEYQTVMNMSPLEREIAANMINKRIEAANKSGHPYF